MKKKEEEEKEEKEEKEEEKKEESEEVKEDEAKTQNAVVAAHTDYFFQVMISNFSLSYTVGNSSNSTSSSSSSLLGMTLKSLELLYFNNIFCPHCPIASSELVTSLDISDFVVRSSLCFERCAM